MTSNDKGWIDKLTEKLKTHSNFKLYILYVDDDDYYHVPIVMSGNVVIVVDVPSNTALWELTLHIGGGWVKCLTRLFLGISQSPCHDNAGFEY